MRQNPNVPFSVRIRVVIINLNKIAPEDLKPATLKDHNWLYLYRKDQLLYFYNTNKTYFEFLDPKMTQNIIRLNFKCAISLNLALNLKIISLAFTILIN